MRRLGGGDGCDEPGCGKSADLNTVVVAVQAERALAGDLTRFYHGLQVRELLHVLRHVRG